MFVDFNILNQLGSPSINSNTFANRPAAGQTGRLFVSTDTFEIYRDNGTTWDLIGGPGSSTITGTGTATQVAYFTSSQAIGSSANLFWDNTSGFLGVATATPTARIEAVKTDGIGIYANFTTNAGSGSGTTGIYSINNTASSGYAAVIEERTGNTTGGQYPLLVKHSLSSGTAGVGMGTGLQFQLPDDAGTFKTTQLTIETINAAAATYATRYRFNVQSNGSSTPVAYINATGVGIFTATPGAALDVHSTGTIAQFNTTSGTGNTYIAFQRTGTGLWRIGDTYNAGNNFFELHNTVLAVDALEFEAATNKSTFQAQQTYTTGLARGNYFDFNLSVAAGGSFSSPNAITALGASLDLTLAGNATIPSGARSGLDAYNSIAFTGAGTLTHTQGTQIRAYSNVTAGWAFNGSATGTITHLAGLRALFPDNSGSAVNVTNNYALLLNDQTANTGTVTYTNRWGVYQEGASDLNYMAANLLLGSTTNSGERLQVTGNALITSTTPNLTINSTTTTGTTIGNKGNRILLQSNSVTVNNGGEIVFAGADTTTYRWGALTGAIQTNSGSGATGNIAIATKTNTIDTTLTERLTVTASGLVGINTTTPGSILDVLGFTASSSNWGNVNITTRNAINAVNRIFTALRLQDSGSGDAAAIGYSYNGTGYDLELATVPTVGGALTERMRITSTGDVGIGITAPQARLNVSLSTNTDSLQTITRLGANNLAGELKVLDFRYQGSTNLLFLQTQAVGTDPNFVFQVGSTEVFRTTSSNVLIGTTTNNGQRLQVNGNTLLSGTLQFTVSGSIQPTLQRNGSSGGLIVNTTATASVANLFEIQNNGVTKFNIVSSTDAAEFASSIKTGAPNTGTAANWKLGSRVAATVVLDTTQYIELDVGGTLYKLAIVT